ncbi:SPOR domain-containing protein [Treponema socranskii]|uniref:SPOR domain-containing protein n=1 Tax=Treponema socranskii TaxID=53419 RepID=UPI003D6FD67D
MEQKGTLWIIAAVGIFLLAVLLPAVILFKPDVRKVQTTAPIVKPSSGGWIAAETPSHVGSVGENETAKSESPADTIGSENSAKSEAGETQTAERNTMQVGDMTVFAQNATVYGLETSRNTQSAPDGSTLIDLNALRSGDTPPSASVTPKNETSAKSMETARQTARASQQAGQEQYFAAESRNTAVKTPAKKPSFESKTASPKTTTPKAGTQKNTAAKPKAAAGKTQYWIQAASFASKNSADTARSILDENKISADVFTYKDGKGKVFYRVRIGPYVTKSEAEYWRTRVAQINDFKSGESYITQTSSATD